MSDWRIFRGTRTPHDDVAKLPEPPAWRRFPVAGDTFSRDEHKGTTYQAREEEIQLVNAALYLRRPLLITGKPGTGKSSLAHAVAYELKLGPVLIWSITTRSTLQDGLYRYDAIGRLQDSRGEDEFHDIGRYVQLGPLGTALLAQQRPRVLLIDEIDKSDIDLPNDLLHIFEEGTYEIPELARLPDKYSNVTVRTFDGQPVELTRGRVQCAAFPLVLLTSNGERDFPPAFLRRCLRLNMPEPDADEIERIVYAHLGPEVDDLAKGLIQDFLERRARGELATDQLLNAVYLLTRQTRPEGEDRSQLVEILLKHLSSPDLL